MKLLKTGWMCRDLNSWLYSHQIGVYPHSLFQIGVQDKEIKKYFELPKEAEEIQFIIYDKKGVDRIEVEGQKEIIITSHNNLLGLDDEYIEEKKCKLYVELWYKTG